MLNQNNSARAPLNFLSNNDSNPPSLIKYIKLHLRINQLFQNSKNREHQKYIAFNLAGSMSKNLDQQYMWHKAHIKIHLLSTLVNNKLK